MKNATIEKIQLIELVESLREQAEDTFPTLKDEPRLMLLSEKWVRNADFCICRNKERNIIGMIVFYANNLQDGIIYLAHVYVNPFCRGKGLFSHLLKKICLYGANHGFKKIHLEVGSTNELAICCYKKNGFYIIPPQEIEF